jgi:hypothetical protein
MARLQGYQRPPHGGRGRCRRACERAPLRGRRRCAAGGRLHFSDHRQRDASQTAKWPRPSPLPIALAHLNSVMLNKICIKKVPTRSFSKCITRAFAVNFHAPFSHPLSKPRSYIQLFNTVLATPPNPLQQVQNMGLRSSLSNMELGMSACPMLTCGADGTMCSFNNFMGIYSWA